MTEITSAIDEARCTTNGLPPGWVTASIDQVAQVNPSKPPRCALPAEAAVTFVPMAAVDGETGTIVGSTLRPYAEVRTGHPGFVEGDVIIAKITPCMENGKAAVARGLQNGMAFGSTEFHVLRPSRAVLPEFLFHHVRQESFRREARNRMAGAVGQMRVPEEFIRNAEFALPPVAEQLRIVAKLDEVLPQLLQVGARLTKLPAVLSRFRQAVLAAACSGQLTEDWREQHCNCRPSSTVGTSNYSDLLLHVSSLPSLPPSWRWCSVKEVASVQGGIQKQPSRAPKHNAFPYLRVANVHRDRLELAEISEMELFEGELDVYRLEPDDLLIVEGNGSLSEVGRSAIWTDEIANCVHQNHIIRVRATCCSPKYLNTYWNSPQGRGLVSSAAVTTSGLYSLSTKKVANMPVPLPPDPEQAEIVRRVDALLGLAKSVDQRLSTAAVRTRHATQAVLAKAFRGDLVPTEAELARHEGRDYEPADVLVERIKTERKAN